tara:strand:+ start:374 stop:589 length:216 start_codon:yes stop_codon:yes gene_type:complete
MNLNYVDEDNCPVIITLTMREIDWLIKALKDVEGVQPSLQTGLSKIRTEAIERGGRAFRYMAEREELRAQG